MHWTQTNIVLVLLQMKNSGSPRGLHGTRRDKPEKILSVWKECLQGTTAACQSGMTYLRVGYVTLELRIEHDQMASQ